MRNSTLLTEAAAATRRFLDDLKPWRPARLEVKVSSPDGMPLLCAVEAVLEEKPLAWDNRELVWLAATAEGDVHRLQLMAYAAGGNELLAQAAHEFAR
ncbi:MAG: hypothetical protein KGO51_01500 [Alphaproteobacteria bacterium]|nr:hypothetical protein [Alphaproteobacteria bacterium]